MSDVAKIFGLKRRTFEKFNNTLKIRQPRFVSVDRIKERRERNKAKRKSKALHSRRKGHGRQ